MVHCWVGQPFLDYTLTPPHLPLPPHSRTFLLTTTPPTSLHHVATHLPPTHFAWFATLPARCLPHVGWLHTHCRTPARVGHLQLDNTAVTVVFTPTLHTRWINALTVPNTRFWTVCSLDVDHTSATAACYHTLHTPPATFHRTHLLPRAHRHRSSLFCSVNFAPVHAFPGLRHAPSRLCYLPAHHRHYTAFRCRAIAWC